MTHSCTPPLLHFQIIRGLSLVEDGTAGIHARVKQHSSRHRFLAAISWDVNTTARLKPGESLYFPSFFSFFFVSNSDGGYEVLH